MFEILNALFPGREGEEKSNREEMKKSIFAVLSKKKREEGRGKVSDALI